MDVIIPTIRPTNVNTWVVTALQQIVPPLFIIIDIFALVVPEIYSYVLCLIL